MEKIAAIDVGSNAVRVAIAHLESKKPLQVFQKYRLPLRLGVDAFSDQKVFSDCLIDQALNTFSDVRNILENEGVIRYQAFATSAFRDAKNAQVLARRIKQKTGLVVDAISGDLEAKLILNAVKKKINLKAQDDYLLFDLGGGSLELSMIEHGEIKGSKSFDFGTLRYLELTSKGAVIREKYFEKIKNEISLFIDKELRMSKNLNLIGTGGNFRRILKLKRLILSNDEKFIRIPEMNSFLSALEAIDYHERITKFKLRADRADVIIPAIRIIQQVIADLPVKKIYCPNVGLINGILFSMIGKN